MSFEFGGLIYIGRGLFLEFYGILHQLRLNCCRVFSKMNIISQIRNCWQFCKMFFVMFISNSGSFCIFILYFYYKNKILSTQLVKKLIIYKEHNHLHDNDKHNWKGTRGESLSKGESQEAQYYSE